MGNAQTRTHSSACVPEYFMPFPGLDSSTELVVCTPDSDILEYQGTRATLETEGFIPAGTDWPEGFNDLHWDDGKFRYWLRRKRPEGQKGPRRQLINVDWWMLRCDPLNAKPFEVRNVERKAKELADTIYCNSAKGKAEWRRQWNLYFESKKDKAFQSFKAACSIVERKRGRPRKCEESAHGAES